ncbi:hypothetical protein C1645_793620 [Glomus cerebriforme]|uniref:F-box domain-containing protein n=1 Tax=Glomus cerebriforme TaxID=658196 RepID=A0A397S068_9GLOM|nr:hypothetical protein C1645_793620 [Glomus cerebriforme]
MTASSLQFLLKFLYPACNSISSFHFNPIIGINNDIISTEESLSQFINSQHSVKKISFKNGFSLMNSLKNSNCSNTLKIIKFYNIDFKNIINLKEVFEQLNVLESIHMIYCRFLNSNFIQQIISISKPFKLTSLFMAEELSTDLLESFSLLLQKSGEYLENIDLIPLNDENSRRQSSELIERYCTKIKFMIINNRNSNIHLALDLIKNVGQNIRYLDISLITNDGKHSSILLLNLGQILPSKLEYLSLTLSICTSDLEVFLKNSKNTFIEKLVIQNEMREKSDDILPYIKEYVMKERRIRYLAILSYYKSENSGNNELFSLKNEVNEFKLYNIQVKTYWDLNISINDFINEMY